jgi:hypothetical protein
MFDFCVVAMARCRCRHFAVAVSYCAVLGSILDTDVRLKHAPAPDIPRTLTTHPARRRQGEARPTPAQNWSATASLTYPSKQTRPQSRPCEARHETLTLPIWHYAESQGGGHRRANRLTIGMFIWSQRNETRVFPNVLPTLT